MSNKELTIVKENVFVRIVNFFKRFFKKGNTEIQVNIEEKEKTKTINKEDAIEKVEIIQKYDIDKKQFLQLYEQAKNGEIDLLSLEPEQLNKMCILIEEEIKIQDSIIERNREEIKKYA